MDLFKVLGSGARFNKKRFTDDISLFEPSNKLRKTNDTSDTQMDIMQEINFFHNSKSAIDETLGVIKDKKITKDVEKDQEGEESINCYNDENEDEDDPAEEEPLVKDLNSMDDVKSFRKRHRIHIYGTDIPNPFSSFDDLGSKYNFQPYICKNLKNSAYEKPTPIQMQAIPIMIHGRDLMAMAPTGSGKTLAYIIPMLHDLKGPEKIGYRALIISPTRELAQQIYREFKKMAVGKKFKVCMLTKATAATQAQTPHLREKFDILISTPLRLVHAIQQDIIELKNVRHLILDEADKLLELGFLEQTDEIFAACSNVKLQKALFSATFPSSVETLANDFMKDPIRVVIGLKNAATETIKQKLLYVGQEEGKLIAVRQLIQEGFKPPVLIFVQSIERAKELFHELIYDGINVDVIHSERTKAQRDSIILNLKQGKIWVLIATELMARGMDFKGVNLVINYDFPQSVQSYIHRIGRTGRAGRSGEAVTYYTKDDAPYLKSVVNVMKESGCEVPDWMLQLKNPSRESKKRLQIIEASKKRKARKLAIASDKNEDINKGDTIYGDKKEKKDKSKGDNNSKYESKSLLSNKKTKQNNRKKKIN
ncbi:P-loop containing nucleoside triphosphate hydrolase protein [Rhizophagus irregularis]|uniref:RNA helicase n=1 Tax=Rhizophagus irregularis TaxID=588596 RepID=A0A2I1FTP2_9GLOM|nr:P-loop containing nucleoside triphosphate hydrolase protein [Rhizophagus irregularis]